MEAAYAAARTIPQMEAAYRRHKKTGLLITRGAIRAVASAYISQQKYYRLGAFVASAGATPATCSGTCTSSPSRPTSR